MHLVDLPGHGASAPLASFDADAVADLLDQAFPLPAQVVGWSLGGLVAQHWAARHPDKIKSLALVATSPRFVRDESWPHAQERKSIEAVAASLDGAFEQTLERFLALQMMGAPSARHLEGLARGLFSHGRPQGLLPALELLLEADARALAASAARWACSTASATPLPRSAPAVGWPPSWPTPGFMNSASVACAVLVARGRVPRRACPAFGCPRMTEAFYTDKARVRASFEKAAASYDSAAVLQREVSDRMAERLQYIKFQPQVVLDAGAGTGYGAAHCAASIRRRGYWNWTWRGRCCRPRAPNSKAATAC